MEPISPTNYPMGLQAGSTSKPSPLMEETDKLDRMIGILSENMGKLVQKLQPITVATPETSVENQKNPEQVKSQYVQMLSQFGKRIDDVNRVIQYLLHQVEV